MDSAILFLNHFLFDSNRVGAFIKYNPWYYSVGVVVGVYAAIAVYAIILRVVRKHGQIVTLRLGAFSNSEYAREVKVVSGDVLAEIIHEEMFGREGHAYLKNGVVLPTKFIRDKAPALVIDVGANIGLFAMSMQIFGEKDLKSSSASLACRIPSAADDQQQQEQEQAAGGRRSASAQRRSASASRKKDIVAAPRKSSAAAAVASSYTGPLLPVVRVIGFEPIPETFECCRYNYDLVFAETNKAFPQHASRVYQFGIGDTTTTARFNYDPASSAAATMNMNDMVHAFQGRFIEAVGAWMIDAGRYPLQHLNSFSSYMWAPLCLTLLFTGKALSIPFFPARLVAFIFALPLFVAIMVFRIFTAPGAKQCDCQIITLPDALKRAGVDDPDQSIAFLKIDVEGAEEQVCNGIDDVTWARVHQAVIEVHDSPDGRLNRLVNMLMKQGFKRIVVGEEPLEMHKIGQIKTIFATRG